MSVNAMEIFSRSSTYKSVMRRKGAGSSKLEIRACPDGDWIIFYDGASICEMSIKGEKVILYRSDIDIEQHNRPVIEEYEIVEGSEGR